VRGLDGQTQYKTIIAESEHDVAKIDFSRPVHLYAQTTMNPDKYRHLKNRITELALKAGARQESVKCTNSICGQVSGRVPRLKQFCRHHDVVLFVSYIQSSNGKLLFEQCKSVNKNSYFVSEAGDINPEWFAGAQNTGITGATSTPRWLLDEFAAYVNGLGFGV
jgi:4-hydroxy-3-methylbut-2-enyl diphosphate reductase